MLQFGKLNQVKTMYSREGGATREQSYNGIKFRKALSSKGKKKAEQEGKEFTPFVETTFYVSNALFNKLNLAENGFAVYDDEKGVYLALVSDTDEDCKIFRKARGDKKTPLFSAPNVEELLTKLGVLSTAEGNQFLTLTEVQVEELPANVKAVYQVVIDTTVTEEDKAAEAGVSSETEDEFGG